MTLDTAPHRPASRTARQEHSLAGSAGTLLDGSPRLDLAALGDIVAGLARAEDLWHPHVAHDAVERARVRLLATPVYEVWLLGWTPGQSVGLHDHGGSNGAFVVVDGELVETFAPDGAHPSARRLAQRTIAAGGMGTIAAGAAHDVANRSHDLATSLHVYSRPLRSMGFYDDDDPAVRGHRVRTLWVEETPAVLDGQRFGEHHPG